LKMVTSISKIIFNQPLLKRTSSSWKWLPPFQK
jgi:hypothetical protein